MSSNDEKLRVSEANVVFGNRTSSTNVDTPC